MFIYEFTLNQISKLFEGKESKVGFLCFLLVNKGRAGLKRREREGEGEGEEKEEEEEEKRKNREDE